MSFLTGDLTLQWPHTVLGHSDLGLAAADAASFATGRLTVHASTSVLLHGWQMFVSFIFSGAVRGRRRPVRVLSGPVRGQFSLSVSAVCEVQRARRQRPIGCMRGEAVLDYVRRCRV